MTDVQVQRVTGEHRGLTVSTTATVEILPDGRAIVDLGHMLLAFDRDQLMLALGVPPAVIRSRHAVAHMENGR